MWVSMGGYVYIRTTSHLHLPVAAVSSQGAAGTSDDANDTILSKKVYGKLAIVTWEECECEESYFLYRSSRISRVL